jgi:hypothetical protein
VVKVPSYRSRGLGSIPGSTRFLEKYPSRWRRGILYPQKLAVTSSTSGGRSVGIVRSRTQATEYIYGFRNLITAFTSVNKYTRKYGGSKLNCLRLTKKYRHLKILLQLQHGSVARGSEMLLQLYGIINVSAVQRDIPALQVASDHSVATVWPVAKCILSCNSELFIPHREKLQCRELCLGHE